MKILRVLLSTTALISSIALVACSDQNGNSSYNGQNGEDGAKDGNGGNGGDSSINAK